MLLVSWNVAGRTARLDEQAHRVLELDPDFVCLRDACQELHGSHRRSRPGKGPAWGGGCRLDHLIASAEVEVLASAYRHDWRREARLRTIRRWWHGCASRPRCHARVSARSRLWRNW